MSDGVTLPGTGALVRTEDAGDALGVVQVVKPAFGEHGVITPVSKNDPLPASDVQSRGVLERIEALFVDLSESIAALVDAVRGSPARPYASASTSPGALLSPVVIATANASRRGLTVFNEAPAAMYLLLGPTVSTTNYTILVAASGYYEVPYGYTGPVTALWAAAGGNARITEFY